MTASHTRTLTQRIALGALLALVLRALASQLPEVRRYLRVRAM